jgi:predicted nucleic acid-binding protein
MTKRFVDTNLLVYAVDDLDEPVKCKIANEILNGDPVCLSVQVLQEFYTQATRVSRRKALSHEQASSLVQDWCRFEVQSLTPSVLEAAIQTHRRYQISYWDAAVIEAARSLGCDTVLSEDLNHEQDYGGVRVVNPFV